MCMIGVVLGTLIGGQVDHRLSRRYPLSPFVFSGWAPSVMARMFVGPLFGYLLWRGLTNEVKAFIQRAPEFR